MLFEIIDPFLMWKQLYIAIREGINGSGSPDVRFTSRSSHSGPLTSLPWQAIELARFIVHNFRLHDEEVQKLHAPFVAFGVLDLVEVNFLLVFPSSNSSHF